MNDPSHGFDEVLISGYLDGELTQGDEQRVRIHLENCGDCARVADDLRRMKEATMTTAFQAPEDTQWDETPRNGLSRSLQFLGLALFALWAVGLAGALAWQASTDAESVRFEALLGLAPVVAIALIVASALADRWQTRKTDPYRKVQK